MLGSGSSGNSLVVWDEDTMFMIDAGFTGRETGRRMHQICQNPEDITTILISHDHSDHVKGAGVISRRYSIPITASETVLGGSVLSGQRLEGERNITSGRAFKIDDFRIKPFKVPHDASETLGFRIENDGKCLAVATDLGHVPSRVLKKLTDCDALILESNHDIEMLKTGPYPAFLKRRILSKKGHLPNTESGEALAKAISPNTKHVTLAHISHENNKPEIALKTVKSVLKTRKLGGVMIIPSSQNEVGDVVEL